MKIFRSLFLVSLSLVLMLSVSSTPLLAQQNEVISKNQINYEPSLYVTNENLLNNELEARAKWDGQFSSNYTIPSYVVASAATYGMFHITRYLTATLQLGPAAAAAFAGMVSGYVSAKGEIKLKAVQKYRWLKKYTKAEYQATTKIYVNGKYKTTTTKKWISKVDTNIDRVK
ncbi:hypothetical protein [Bacillus altitudinis]|uniref:hypothetical protein n=1 Tax=Bacillus altitudinis TaxID=293387 RepID=UPI000DBBE39B|nr:hypothetical protein [Bacillus altitudinis]SPR92850.1 conserved exported hypothetical protein [Bacillus altitudinis]